MKNAMAEVGIAPPAQLINDGLIHRFHIEGDKSRSENGWYVGHDNPPAGAFGTWKDPDTTHKWSEREYKSYTPEEKAAYKANMEAAKLARAQEQARIHSQCREESKAIWEQAQPAPADHPYLVKKGIGINGAKVHEGFLILPLRDGQGNIHGLQKIQDRGFKRFITGTSKAGNYFSIGGAPTDVLYLAEGFATAATIHEATGQPVAVCFDCGNLKPVAEVLRDKFPALKIIIAGDNDPKEDGSNTGKTKATEAALSIGGLVAVVEMPEGAQGSDYNDLASVAGLNAVREQLAKAAYPTSNEEKPEHPAPLPLPAELLPVEPFDSGLLPTTFEPWIRDICEQMQCPPDFVAVGVMTALAAVIGRKVAIRPQGNTAWTVIPNMWAMVIGKPGVMKSPALGEAKKPLSRLVAKASEDFKEAEKAYKVAAAKAEYRKEANKKELKAEMKKPMPSDDLILALLEGGEDVEPPHLRRYETNDSTHQALAELMRYNQNGLLVFRDELVSLLKSLDEESQAEARGFYLTAWNGDEQYIADRIGRGQNMASTLCISMLGGTQPGRVSEYVRHAIKGGSGDDGLIQRFGLMVWPDTDSAWEDHDEMPDSPARNRAFEIFETLDQLDYSSIGAEQDTDRDGEPDGVPYLRFTPTARKIFLEWRRPLERMLRNDELPDALTSHFAKYRKLIPSIALILHLAEGGSGPVSETATIKALAWGEYLDSHARRVYGSLTHHEVTAAKAIIAKIKQGKLNHQFSSKDVWRPQWSKLADRKQVERALQLLVDYQWLFEEVKNDTGGRPANIYTANQGAL